MPDIDYATGLEWYRRTLAAISRARARSLALAGLGGEDSQLAALAAVDRLRTLQRRAMKRRASAQRPGPARPVKLKRTNPRRIMPRRSGVAGDLRALAPVTAGTPAAAARVNKYLSRVQSQMNPLQFRRLKARIFAALNEAAAAAGGGSGAGPATGPGNGPAGPGGGSDGKAGGGGIATLGPAIFGSGTAWQSNAGSSSTSSNQVSNVGLPS
jgi:hypothetical protein